MDPDLNFSTGFPRCPVTHHLQLNLAKTELLVVSANPAFHHNFTFQLGSSTITPSKTARNLGVVIDDKLNFSDHTAKTARSCRFALYNIKKIRPFLSEHATQLFVQALVLSRLDYCTALLAGLPVSSIKPLQLIQNAAARLIFNEPKRTHVTPLFIKLHWLPIAARIKFKALMFANRTTSGSAPLYLNSLLQTFGAFPLHGTVRYGTVRFGTAWYGTVRLSSGRFAFPPQFSTAIEWAGLFTRRYNCAASTDVTSS